MPSLISWQAALMAFISVGISVWLQSAPRRYLSTKYVSYRVCEKDRARTTTLLTLFVAASLAISFFLGQPPLVFFTLALLLPLMGFMALFDLEFHLFPDRFQLAVLVVSFGSAFMIFPLGQIAFGLASGWLLALVLWLASATYETLRKRPALGLGDIKLLAAVSPLCGHDLLAILTLASFICLAWLGWQWLRGKSLPSDCFAFGPHLVASITVWLLYSF